jgi:hypothetical protein
MRYTINSVKYQAYMSLVFDLDMGRRNPWEEEER